MRHRPDKRGFTIIETLIFLVVSASVFGAAITQYTGQQHSNEFTQGVQGLVSQLQLLQNEVASSFSVDLGANNFRCVADNLNNPPDFSLGDENSDNSTCIFLGRAFGFGNTALCSTSTLNDCAKYVVIPIVGRRLEYVPPGNPYPVPASSYAAAKPIGLAKCTLDGVPNQLPCGLTLPSLSNRPNLADRAYLKNGVGIYKAFVRDSAGNEKAVTVKSQTGVPSSSTTIGAFSYLLSLNRSGTQATPAVDLVWLPTPFAGNTEQKTTHSIDNLGTSTTAEEDAYKNPTYGIALCIYGAYGQKTEIILGANNNPADVKKQPDNNLDPGCS